MLINQDPQWSGVAASEVQMFPDLEPMDGDCSLLPDDLFQTLSAELGIPLVLGEDSSSGIDDYSYTITKDVTLGESLCDLEDLDINLLQQSADTSLNVRGEIKHDIKLEPASPYVQLPLSPTLSYSDSNGSESLTEVSSNTSFSDFKPALETPPISPPQNISPSTSPEPVLNATFSEHVKLIPLKPQDINHTKYILSKGNTAKRIKVEPKSDQSRDAIFLTAQEFAALTQKVKQNYVSYPITAQLLPVNGHAQSQNSIHLSTTHIKSEAGTIQIPQQKQVKVITGNISDVQTPGKEPATTVSDASLLLKNGTTSACTSIVVKNDTIGCTPIVIKTERPSYTPIVIKNEMQEVVSLPGRQECEIKALKRQQRMIKNRESACLSRKKKKEYVSSLEKQICDLEQENKQLKLENTSLKQRLIALEETTAARNNFKNLNLNVNKKNAAILLGMVFMVSLNVNGFGSILSHNNKLDTLPADVPVSSQYVRHGRTLLWTDSKGQVQEEVRERFNKNASIHQLMCPMHINRSESIRLDYELRRWIGGESDQDDWTMPKKAKLDAKSLDGYFPSSGVIEKKSKNKYNLSRRNKSDALRKTANTPMTNVNAVEVFSPILREHASLFDALGRRDDTFYVVWFSGEHLLLPASRKNSTGRPKMSLVLPALPINETFSTPANHITMMQIDCEVTNTQLLHLKQSVIPDHLRNNNKRESYSRQTETANDISDPVTTNSTKSYKPYFMKETDHKVFHKRNLKDIYIDKNGTNYNKETAYILKQKFISEFDLEEIKPEVIGGLKKTDRTKTTTLKKKLKTPGL